ncbi:MAG: hypothetical protein WCR06_07785 [bacterium]
MALSNEQRQAVKQWVEQGIGLSPVQTRIKSEFGVSMTFLETRMLVQELGAQVKDKPAPKKPAPPPQPEQLEDDGLDAMPDEAPAPPAPDGLIAGKVTVSLDRVVRAGAVASGEVTFSEGTRAKWMLDQMGRLGLDGTPPNYRPPAQDIQEFQTQLRSLLQTRGY